jgi:hypothetical protein
MKTDASNFRDNRVFSSTGRGSEGHTHKEIENYLAKARRLRSKAACSFFMFLWRSIAAVFVQSVRRIASFISATRAALADRINGLRY